MQNLPFESFPIYSSTLLVILSSWGAVTYHSVILRTCMQDLHHPYMQSINLAYQEFETVHILSRFLSYHKLRSISTGTFIYPT